MLTACLVAGMTVGWDSRIYNLRVADSNSTAWSGRIVRFDVDLVSVDADAGSMVLDWYVHDDSLCSDTQSPVCSVYVDIFFDSNLLRQLDSPVPSANDIPGPLFRWNASAPSDTRRNIAAFRTDLALLLDLDHSASNLQNYPFDIYSGELFVFAQQSDTNATVGVEIFSATGVAVGFKVVVQRNAENQLASQIDDILVVSRGSLVKAYAIVIVISLWIITLIFVLSSMISVVFGYRQPKEILLIPVTTLFAFTGLRSTMPGAPPGFGATIDYIGILPCLALIAVCAALTLGLLVFVDPQGNRKDLMEKKDIMDKHHDGGKEEEETGGDQYFSSEGVLM